MKSYYLKILATLLVLLCPATVLADKLSDNSKQEPMELIDYQNTLDILAENRKGYNELNDTTRFTTSKESWIQLFRYRANVFSHLYEFDGELIEKMKYDIDAYALADSVYYSNDATFGDLYHLKSVFLLNQLNSFALSSNSDPFLVKYLAKPLCDLVIRKMPESEISIMAAHLMAMSYKQILRFNDNKQLSDEFIAYCTHAISFDRRMPTISSIGISSFVAASYAMLFSYKNERMGDIFIDNYNRMKALMADEQMKEYFAKDGARIKKTFDSLLSTSAYSILRNHFMTYEWDKHTSFTDSIANKDLERQSIYSKKLIRTAFSKRALTEVYLGKKTYDEAFAEVQTFYADSLAPKNERISVGEISLYTNPILTLIYLIDNSSLPFEVKRAHVLEYANAVLETVRKCKDNQSNNIRNSIVMQFLTYDRLLSYMTSQEKENFFHSMIVYTQVQTYAHSMAVAKLSQRVTNAVIDSRPDLLVGLLGSRSNADVKKNRKKYLDIMQEAALYHDLGKLSMAELVKNDYRPMTDDEFAIIKLHPERGAKILECDSSLMKYHDFVIGHHKWYDGKGGYPRNYDNTKSAYRVLVDVLTICDCLDAATDRVARNYANKKRYADLVKEFQAQSGTRYNPDIVELLASDKDLIRDLTKTIEGGWVETYFEIYKDYFSK